MLVNPRPGERSADGYSKTVAPAASTEEAELAPWLSILKDSNAAMF